MNRKIILAAMLLNSCNLFALELTVSGFNYTPITLTVQKEHTIGSIKDEIATRVDIKSSNQRLMFDDVELNSNSTLQDYDILSNATLTLEFKPQVLSDSKETVLLYDLHQLTKNVTKTVDAQLGDFYSDGETVLFTHNSVFGNELGSYTPSTKTFLNHDINVGASSSTPSGFMLFNDSIYFSAYNSNTERELYYFDSTTKIPVLVGDINPNGSSINSSEAEGSNHSPSYKAFKDHLYFVADNGVHGFELWALDANNTPEMIIDIFEGSSSSDPRFFSNTEDYLYFVADSSDGNNLIRLNGDTLQTEIIATYSEITHLTTTVEDAFFVAKDEQGKEQLYQFDSNSNTVEAVNDPESNLINTFSGFDSLVAVKNSVYFNAKSTSLSDYNYPTTFWQFDSETSISKRFDGGALAPASVFGVFKNKLFFTKLGGYDSAPDTYYHYRDVYIADDKTATKIRSFNYSDERGGYTVQSVKQHGNSLYYSAKDRSTDILLDKVSLTTNGLTHLLAAPYPKKGEVVEGFKSLAFVDDKIYYSIEAYTPEGNGNFLESYDVSAKKLETIKFFGKIALEEKLNYGSAVRHSNYHSFSGVHYFLKSNKLMAYNEALDQFRQLSTQNFESVISGYNNKVYLFANKSVWLYDINDKSLIELYTDIEQARFLKAHEEQALLITDYNKFGNYKHNVSLLNMRDSSLTLDIVGASEPDFPIYFAGDIIYFDLGLLYQYKNDALEVALPSVTLINSFEKDGVLYFIAKSGDKLSLGRFDLNTATYKELEEIYNETEHAQLNQLDPIYRIEVFQPLVMHNNRLFYCAYKNETLQLIAHSISDNSSQSLAMLGVNSNVPYYTERCTRLVSHEKLYIEMDGAAGFPLFGGTQWEFDDRLIKFDPKKLFSNLDSDWSTYVYVYRGDLFLQNRGSRIKLNHITQKFEPYLTELSPYNWSKSRVVGSSNGYYEINTSKGYFIPSELYFNNEIWESEYVYFSDNRAPSISGVPQANIALNQNYKFIPKGFDMDGQPLIYSIENKPDWLDFDPQTGVLSGVSSVDSNDAKDVVISVTDGHVSKSLAPFDITITFSAPLAIADTASLDANSNVQIDVLSNDTDPQNASLKITEATATSGDVKIVSGMLHYTALKDFVGSDVITYTIENEFGLSASAEVQVTVKEVKETIIEQKKKSSGSLYLILFMLCSLVLYNRRDKV